MIVLFRQLAKFLGKFDEFVLKFVHRRLMGLPNKVKFLLGLNSLGFDMSIGLLKITILILQLVALTNKVL